MTMGHAAGLLSVSRACWNDWEKRKRVPGPALMVEIYRATGGVVTPNDFYALPGAANAQASACTSIPELGVGTSSEGAEGREGACSPADRRAA